MNEKAILLEKLLDEAKAGLKKSTKEFEKHDNHEDMHEMWAWQHTVDFLKKHFKFHKNCP